MEIDYRLLCLKVLLNADTPLVLKKLFRMAKCIDRRCNYHSIRKQLLSLKNQNLISIIPIEDTRHAYYKMVEGYPTFKLLLTKFGSNKVYEDVIVNSKYGKRYLSDDEFIRAIALREIALERKCNEEKKEAKQRKAIGKIFYGTS